MIVYDGEYANSWLSPDSSSIFAGYVGGGGSLASWILEDVFNFSVDGAAGGSVEGYDIVHRDAYQMIQLSLAEELASGDLYECYANEHGSVKFYNIGREAGIGGYLYELPSESLTNAADNVIVSGFDPPPVRVAGPVRNVLDDIEISILGEIGGSEFCTYKQDGYIIYPKQTEIDRYEANPKNYEQVVAHVYSLTVPMFDPKFTSVEFANTSLKYDVIESFGKLQTQKWKSNIAAYEPAYCADNFGVDEDTGVSINPGAGFLGIKAVYVFGYRLKHINLDINFVDGDRKAGPANFLVDLDTTKNETFQLSAGSDYIVVQDSDGSYRLVFSCNVSPDYVSLFDGDGVGGNNTFRISPSSIYGSSDLNSYADISDVLNPDYRVSGVLRDGVTSVDNQEIYDVQIFPLNEGDSGYVVNKIIVAYEWDLPCIHISDLRNNVDSSALAEVEFLEYPILVIDRPAPVSMNGGALDPSQSISDLDISTVENLDNSEYTQAFNSLDKGDINIGLPFLSQNECNSVSRTIQELANKPFNNNTYIFPPNASPILGGTVGNSTINSISYSYQDSSQYFISVTTGPTWLGTGSWSTSLRHTRTENVTAEAIVGSVAPDNASCTVYVPRKGQTLPCVNGCKEILHPGDRVSVTISNNPQGY